MKTLQTPLSPGSFGGERVMGRKAIVVSEDLRDAERRLTAILDFFGIPWEVVGPRALWDSVPPASDPGYCVFSAMDQVGRRLKSRGDAPSWPPLFRNADSVFFFGSEDSEANLRFLRWLTPGAALSLRPIQGGKVLCFVSNEQTEICGPLSGLRIPVTDQTEGRTAMAVDSDRRWVPLIVTDEGSIFATVRCEGTQCFVASCSTLIDIRRTVEKGYFDVGDYFCSAAPLVMYLRYAFGKGMPAPPEHGACLIVDDPVLRPQYGFLDFPHIAALCREHHFTCTIAFIPWNWRRSHRSVVELFRRHPEQLSLCIHGCDHTATEFSGSSVPWLTSQAQLAIRRMERHQARTGVSYDPVMVFPQGAFSAAALMALKQSGFLAAVNTEVAPLDQSSGTEISEAWRPAILQYGNLAIFTRRYPFHGLHNFAFDLLLGKPCLIVTHHSDFQEGGRGLLDFIDQLNSLQVPLKWRTLGTVVRRAYHQRLRSDGVLQIRMYGGEVLVENAGPESRAICVEKSEPTPEAIERLEVGGRNIAFEHDQGYLRFAMNLAAGEGVPIRIVYKEQDEGQTRRSLRHSTTVLVRRCLSEFRDETQAKAPWIYHCAQNLRDWMSPDRGAAPTHRLVRQRE